MHLSTLSTSLLLTLPVAALAVFQDEVDHIDYHYQLLGLPQQETTFFHRPRREDKASLLYTLSDVGVLGAVNPSNGAVVWRHPLTDSSAVSKGGFLRAGEGESWVVSALGHSVHAWDGITGRNVFWEDFDGEVRDLEVMEMTEEERKDTLVLFEENGSTVLRRLHGTTGRVVWEFKETTKDLPLQVSTDISKVYVVSLHGTAASHSLKVTALDTLTGKRLDEFNIGTKGDVHSEKDVMFVGANSAAPIVAWTDDAKRKLRVNVLGTKTRQEFELPANTLNVTFHAPHLVQSQPHFLVHAVTKDGHSADVYHVDLKSNTISKAYSLPPLEGHGAFATSSIDSNVYFTRVTEDKIALFSSMADNVLGNWPVQAGNTTVHPLHTVSEVIKRGDNNFAVRSAVVTEDDNYTLLRNGEVDWTRPEGLSAAVAATFVEIPESEDYARTLEQEADGNPLSAYIHRVKRHVHDLQGLPEYLQSIPKRLVSSILGTDVEAKTGRLVRDNFGFHKLVVLATARGRLYCLDIANHGKIVWSTKAFDIPAGENWVVRGISADDHKSLVTVRAADGEHVIVNALTGKLVERASPGTWSSVQSTAVVDSASGKWMLTIGPGGKVGGVPAPWAPTQTVVVRGAQGELKGLSFVPNDAQALEETAWTFVPPVGQDIVEVASRPSHDPVASIGRVLGDRRVKYKYLNPNTIVVATKDEAASTATVYLLDTVSGEVLSSSTYEGVDTSKPISCAMSENWFVCTFFGEYLLRANPSQSIKGYQMVVSDLYESDEPNDRGPLGDAANFSSVGPLELPNSEPVLPSVVSQAYVLSAPVSALAVTQTRQGITTRHLLAYLKGTHGIVGIPRPVLEPRRPVGRDPTPAELEEGLFKYLPAIEMDPKSVITHERDVLGIERIITAPTVLESTSLVFAYGIDVFGTRVAPSFAFDILGKGFNKLSMMGTVAALAVGAYVLGPIVRRKQINSRWTAPL